MSKKWMNGLIVLTVAIGLLVVAAGCTSQQKPAKTPDKKAVAAPVMKEQPNNQPSIVLKTPMDQMSYSLGVETIKNLKKQKIEISPDAMCQGIKDAMAGDKFLMDDDELQETYGMFQALVRGSQARSRMNAVQNNKIEGDEFLAANKTKPGVITLPSGVQYKIIRQGSGPKPMDSDTIQCYYRGTLVDGTKYDSSAHDNNEGAPAIVSLSSCIPGWREAIKLMPVGSKWQIFIPSDLAYGPQAHGRHIGPNCALIYEVELVGIQATAK
jgi:FKBP-type peptidyl-prolyl cis-trans isomerase